MKLTFQLVCVIYADPNTYGSASGYILGLILRLGGGEPFFGLAPFIYYPGGAYFPFKTFSMLMSGLTILVISRLAKFLFVGGYVDDKWDLMGCNLAHGGRSYLGKKKSGNAADEKADVKKLEVDVIDGKKPPTYDNKAFEKEVTRM